jgi:hypothetical protein
MIASVPRSARLRAGLALLVACCAAGCASNKQLADQVVDANLAQEDAGNRLLLLNVLRARYRNPMHFTKISAVRAPVGLGNPTFTIPTPFGPDFKQQIYNVSTQLSVQQGVDSIVLDTQEFMRGITTPVAPGLMTYMLDQGWPQQMVLNVFVRSIEFYEDRPGKPGEKPKPVMVDRMENAPANDAEFARFQQSVDRLRLCEIALKSGSIGKSAWSPVLSPAVVGDLKGLAAVKAADLVLVGVDANGKETTGSTPAGYQLMRDQKAVQFETRDRPESFPGKCPGLQFRTTSLSRDGKPVFTEYRAQLIGAVTGNAGDTVDAREAAQSQMSSAMREIAATPRPAADPNEVVPIMPNAYAIFNLRSPEAMMYYLGEIARHQSERPDWDGPRVKFGYGAARTDNRSALLFRVSEGAAPAASPVAVAYRGASYSIGPTSDNDRSMHTLSLINQVLMLQNKGADLPATANIRILQ